jgi:hypothetical protein
MKQSQHTENVEDYMGMIHKAVKKVKPSEALYQDLVSEGILIFYTALKCFDETKGAKFSTHLTIHLQQLFNRYWYKYQDKAYLFKYNKQQTAYSGHYVNGGDCGGERADMDFVQEPVDENQRMDLALLYTELTPDAKHLHTVITSGTLVAEFGKQLRLTITNLLKIVEEWGWDSTRLKAALIDLREFIYEMFENTVELDTLGYKHNKL